jgi:tellurium resistance protein TerD
LGLGWEPPKGAKDDYDLDVTLLPYAQDGTLFADWVCFYNNMDTGWAKHTADVRDGVGSIAGTQDDEQITLPDLSKIPPEVHHFAVVVTIYEAEKRHQNFGDLTFAFIRVEDPDKIMEAKQGELTADMFFDCHGMLFGVFTRKGPAWAFEFKAEGGPQWKDLDTIQNEKYVVQ